LTDSASPDTLDPEARKATSRLRIPQKETHAAFAKCVPKTLVLSMKEESTYFDPGTLVDADLELVLEETLPSGVKDGYQYPPAYRFAMRRVGTEQKIGEIGLKAGENHKHKGHFWYRVLPEYRGHHYAARALRLLIPLARRHGLNPLWITCRENNAASRRTAELARATLAEVMVMPEGYRDWTGPVRRKCRYRLGTEERMDNN